jgi:arylsulfatase A-like enzyme
MKNPGFRDLMSALSVATSSLLPGYAQGSDQVRPNVIVIYTDDMGPEHVRCYGGAVFTPQIDRLAREGVKLNRYYATSAVCTPSRYGLLTGRYASRNRDLQKQYPDAREPAFIRWNTFLGEEERTIAHVMHDAGYVTALVGKHHNLRESAYLDPLPEHADARAPAEIARLERNHDRIARAIKETTGFDYVINNYANNFHVLELEKELHQHNPEWVTAGALAFIEEHKDRPFFMHLATTIPHEPSPTESLQADPRITPRGYLAEAPRSQPSRASVFERAAKAGVDRSLAYMTWLDDSVGAVMDKLRALGLEKRTMVIFAGDHCGAGKLTCYENGVRTPCIIWWPAGIPGGGEINELAANIDLMPTILDACGVHAPKDYVMDGVSLLPMLRGKEGKARESLLLEVAYAKGVVTKGWKFIAVRYPSNVRQTITPENRGLFNQEGEKTTVDAIAGVVAVRYGADKVHPGFFDDDQLYDLGNDPGETRNLAYHSEYQRQRHQMQLLLRSYLREFPNAFGEFH